MRIDVGRDGELLHPVRELFLDDVGDESGERILTDDADDIGELAGRMGRGVAAVDGDPALEDAAGEVRDEPVDRAEQRRLPGARAADDQAELAFVDPQRRRRAAPAPARRRR